jgi:undecaprenyl-diphosphatase
MDTSRFRLRDVIALWLLGASCFVIMAAFASAYDRFPGDLWLTRQFQAVDSSLVVKPMGWAESLVEWPYWGFISVIAATAAVLLVGLRVMPVVALAVLSRELVPLLKDIIGRPRPSSGLVHVTRPMPDSSFPSGHAFNSVLLFGLIFYVATFYVSHRALRRAVQAVCGLAIPMASLARVHDGLHWPSDIAAGLLLGLLLVTLLVVAGESLPGGKMARRPGHQHADPYPGPGSAATP